MGDTLKQAKSITPWGIAEQVVGAGASIYNNERNINAQNRANEMNLQENERNRMFNSQEAEKQRQFEAQQAELANKFSSNEALKAFQRSSKFALDMWNKENEYNSPNAQIKRLVEAGVNPNLFGGDNTAGSVGSVSSSAPSANMPHGSSASANSSIPVAPVTYTNPLLESANIRIANANASKAEAEADKSRKLLPGEIQLQGKTFDLMGSEINVNKAQENFLRKSAEKQDAEITQINKSIDKLTSEINLLDKQGQIVQKEIDSFEARLASSLTEAASRVKLNLANASEVASKIALNYANAQKAKAEAQSYSLSNYLDGVRLSIFKDSSAWTYSMLQNNVRLELTQPSKRAKHENASYEPDYKMYEDMNNDVVSFFRALGSILDLRMTTAIKP